MAAREELSDEEKEVAREARLWKQATRKNRKAPPKKLKPEDRMPREQWVSTKAEDVPADGSPAEMRAQARAAFLSQLRVGE